MDGIFRDPPIALSLDSFLGVDTIKLAGVEAPGQWVLVDAARVYGWQIQHAMGQMGATLFPIADELVEAKFLVKIWEEAQRDSYRVFRRRYLSKPTFRSRGTSLAVNALAIVHPELNDLGVSAVVPKRIPALLNNGKGLWTATVEFYQYRRPMDIGPKPTGQIEGEGAPPKAKDAQDQANLDKLAAIKAARALHP